MGNDWHIFKGDGRKPHQEIKKLDTIIKAPAWRGTKVPYLPTEDEVEAINASIFLRRPLLITGRPGVGKSSLAKEIARELGVEFLHWGINSKSSLSEGLYEYDAISRLQDAQLGEEKPIEEYVTLGALGRAFAKGEKIVLLIDELDKSDIDLPNDLLHILEEREFEISVLKRYTKKDEVNLGTQKEPIIIKNGKHKIDIENMPIIIITSNQERDFSPAFMRRCLYYHIEFPESERLVEIACKHLEVEYKKGEHSDDKRQETIRDLVSEFMDKRNGKEDYHQKSELSIDQLLNAVYLRLNGRGDILENRILNSTILHDIEG